MDKNGFFHVDTINGHLSYSLSDKIFGCDIGVMTFYLLFLFLFSLCYYANGLASWLGLSIKAV